MKSRSYPEGWKLLVGLVLELAVEVNSRYTAAARVAHRFPRCPAEQSLAADRIEF